MFPRVYRHLCMVVTAFATVLCASGSLLYAQVDLPQTEIELRSDNDMYLFILQDQYYTNGLFLNLRRTFDKSKLRSNEKNRLMEFGLGHEIYNAYTAQIDSLEAVDRAITAYLFMSGGVHHYFVDESYLSYELGLGTIGRRAFGETLQGGLHYLLNMYHAAGWEYQLNNAWTVDLSLKHNKLLGRTSDGVLDMSVQSGLRVGTYQLSGGTGPLFRLGRLLSFDQSAHFSGRLQSAGDLLPNEWYIFYRPEISVMLYDTTLQGGMFLKDKGPAISEPRTWRISNNFGAVLSNQHLTMKIQYYFKTKESDRSYFRHQYGSVSLAYRF